MMNNFKNNIKVMDLGHSSYEKVWDLQKKMQSQRINSSINDTLIFVEHEPVYTLGKNANKNHILQTYFFTIRIYF